MAKIRIRYLINKKRKDGSFAWYWQPNTALKKQGWKLTTLGKTRDPLPSGEIVSAAEQINDQVDAWRIGDLKEPQTERAGTVDALIRGYKKSTRFLELKPSTQSDYAQMMNIISRWAGDMPAVAINAKMVQDLYESIRGQHERKAAYVIQVLRILFNYAERMAVIPKNTNPATKPQIRYRSKKGRLWSPEAVKAMVKAADKEGHFALGTAAMLNEWLGQRKGDIITLPMSAWKDGAIYIRQSKTGAEVVLAAGEVPALKARIEEQIKRNKARTTPGTALIQKDDGRPYSADHFTHLFKQIRDKAAKHEKSLEGMIFKDLRHTAVTRLAESGAEIPEIASVTGHSMKAVHDIIDRYNVRTGKMARGAFLKRLKAERS